MTTRADSSTISKYKSDVKPIWCPGCGDFGVLGAFYRVMASEGLKPEQTVIVAGIGCSGRFSAFVNAYGFHVVHGRTLPVATGVKLANPELTVFAVGGDGDAFAIGGGHIPHMARRNVDVTYVIMDNEIYGLTKGQTSPTSALDMTTKATPFGSIETPLNPIALMLAYDVSFVARGYVGKPKQVEDLIRRAVRHRGFAVVELFSPCITYHDTYGVLAKSVVELDASHDPTNKIQAMQQAYREDAIPLGVFYQVERPTYTDQVARLQRQAGASVAIETLFEQYR